MVKAGLSLSGLYELEPVRLSYVNAHLRMDAAEAAALSPARHLEHARGALTVAVGGRESEQFHWHQEHFSAGLGRTHRHGTAGGRAAGPPPFLAAGRVVQPQGVLAREVCRQAGV
jgi:arylformamidase